MKTTIRLFLSLLLFAAVALAHGDEHHLRGTITKVTDKSITIEDKDKKTTEVSVTADTKFMNGQVAAALKDLKAGERVVINAKKSGDKLVATLVRIGTAAAPATAPKH